MYPSSGAYKTAIAAPGRSTRITGVLTLSGGSTVNLTEANLVQGSLVLSEQCVSGDNFEIGNVYASELCVSILTPTSSPWSLAGAKLALSFGIDVSGTPTWEDIPLGVFWVMEIDRKTNFTFVRALDGMILLDVALGATNVTARTIEQLIAGACTTAGVTLATTHTAFETYPNKAMTLTLPTGSEVKTCRDLIMWACQINGTFARMNRAGQLEILPLHSSSVRTITQTERFSPTTVSDSSIQVTGVQEQVLGTVYTQGTTTMMLVLGENPLLKSQTASAINAALTALLADVTQAVYTPFDVDFIGDPTLQAGDYVTLSSTGALGSNPIGLVTHSTWRYRDRHTLSSVGKPGIVKTSTDQTGKKITSLSADLINANRIIAGRLSSQDGSTYFDLTTPEIKESATVGGKAVTVTISPTKPYELAIDGRPMIYISSAGVLVTSIYDVNEDGIVDDTDYNLIKNYLLYGTGYLPRMDVNGDGSVTLTDLVQVKRAALGLGIMQDSGTFAPTLRGGTTAGTWAYTTQSGRYVAFGNMVFVTIALNPSSIGGGAAGDLIVGNLPFTAQGARTVLECTLQGLSWPASCTVPSANIIAASTDIILYGTFNNGSLSRIQVSGMTAGDIIYISGWYESA